MTTEGSVKKAQTEIVHYFRAPLGGVIFKTEMVYQEQENVQWKTLTEMGKTQNGEKNIHREYDIRKKMEDD